MAESDIDAILRGSGSRRRWLILAVVLAVAAVAAAAAYVLLRPGDTEVAFEPERAEATLGQLSTQVELSGSAVPERSAMLGFDVGGVVTSVAVVKGDRVQEGDTLAILQDAEAQRRVETASIQLRQTQLRLDELLAEPSLPAIASAEQAIVSARAQVLNAEQSLAALSEPPSAADIASAEQAVAVALGQISSTEQALADLAEPPNAADIASAEQAVAAALGQISSAEQALADLAEPPSAADIASAEQAVAAALGQISSAEQALADLAAEATDSEVLSARTTITQAEVRLSNLVTLADELNEALADAADAYCDRYDALAANDEVIRRVCNAELPLTDTQVVDLRESIEDRSAAYASFANSLIDANIAFVGADADRETGISQLSMAEETLNELLAPPSGDDVYQAEQAVDAAKASHAAAIARLDDLRTGANQNDVYQARQAVDAAQAGHTAAVTRLGDLQIGASEYDFYQADQAVAAAKASHAAAVARLNDLRAAADDSEVAEVMAALESAQASLATAQAQYDDLLAGPTENEIEQQRHEILLAELSLEEAGAALEELTIFAPFDGVVEDVAVRPGDSVAAGFPAFTLSTSDRILVSLTVTEEELLSLAEGQTGVATFDAIGGVNYPVRVESISRVPVAEQGVVTYEVKARILAGEESGPAGPQGADNGLTAGARAGGFGGGFRGGAAGGPFAGFELPEGVTPEQVRDAIISGQPLPESVVLPEEALRMIETIRSSGDLGRSAGGPAGAGGPQAAGQQDSTGQRGAAAARPLPAEGMSASVTIVTEVRDEAVLVPVSAVRQLDDAWFVSVPAAGGEGVEPGYRRVFVEVGASDGASVEITGGLESDAVVLIGADSAGIAFSATQRLPQAAPGFPTGGGFGPPSGGPGGGR